MKVILALCLLTLNRFLSLVRPFIYEGACFDWFILINHPITCFFSNIKPISPRSVSPSSDTGKPVKLDSVTLREQIYYDWLTRKNSFTKSNSAEKKAEKIKEEIKENEAREKKLYVSLFLKFKFEL